MSPTAHVTVNRFFGTSLVTSFTTAKRVSLLGSKRDVAMIRDHLTAKEFDSTVHVWENDSDFPPGEDHELTVSGDAWIAWLGHEIVALKLRLKG